MEMLKLHFQWKTQTIDLTPFVGERIILRFRGRTGDDFRSDIAIDDFHIVVNIFCRINLMDSLRLLLIHEYLKNIQSRLSDRNVNQLTIFRTIILYTQINSVPFLKPLK